MKTALSLIIQKIFLKKIRTYKNIIPTKTHAYMFFCTQITNLLRYEKCILYNNYWFAVQVVDYQI